MIPQAHRAGEPFEWVRVGILKFPGSRRSPFRELPKPLVKGLKKPLDPRIQPESQENKARTHPDVFQQERFGLDVP